MHYFVALEMQQYCGNELCSPPATNCVIIINAHAAREGRNAEWRNGEAGRQACTCKRIREIIGVGFLIRARTYGKVQYAQQNVDVI